VKEQGKPDRASLVDREQRLERRRRLAELTPQRFLVDLHGVRLLFVLRERANEAEHHRCIVRVRESNLDHAASLLLFASLRGRWIGLLHLPSPQLAQLHPSHRILVS
jgi:hypothetical protein